MRDNGIVWEWLGECWQSVREFVWKVKFVCYGEQRLELGLETWWDFAEANLDAVGVEESPEDAAQEGLDAMARDLDSEWHT
jgi:hypothetical protein